MSPIKVYENDAYRGEGYPNRGMRKRYIGNRTNGGLKE